jgi:dienelactone hydrolase
MRTDRLCASFLLFSAWAFGQSTPSIVPQTVEFRSGKLHLKGYLWKPVGSGPFPAVLFNHGSGTDPGHTAGLAIADSAERLAPVFTNHGYVFLYAFRRGQGLSADQGPFMQNLLHQEEAKNGKEGRNRLQLAMLTSDQLDDVCAAVAFLKRQPAVDVPHIAVVGHSFGGLLSLLAAERDAAISSVVSFAGGAVTWDSSPALRDHMLSAMRNMKVPVMFVQAANDYSIAQGKAMDAELDGRGKPHLLKIYPPIGQNAENGHDLVYEDIRAWEQDVFKFIDQHVTDR